MPARDQIAYFGAGPARLPTSVLNNAATALTNYNNTGLGLVEHSHRSALSSNIISATASSFKKLLSVPDDDSYTVLFMQGGGTTQFSSVVYNLVGYWVEKRLRKYDGDLKKVQADLQKLKCEYILTGGWSSKASQEAARLLGEDFVSIVADGKKSNGGKWGVIPDEKTWKLVESTNSAFTYFCDNETVDGVEFSEFPEVLKRKEGEEERLVVGDMSSNILSRPVDVKKFAAIFAGAQKNIGTTGLTIVLIRSSILECQPTPATLRALNLPIPPIMMHYPTLASNNSLYNTLPIFDVYIAGEVMSLLLSTGGVEATTASAARKSSALYNIIDKYSKVYIPVITDKRVRSRMNVCFRLGKGRDGQDLEKGGLTGVKGHRSVGGARVSCYNAIQEEEINKLVAYMKEFAEKQGHTYLALN
ncbi:pyridoxal phosphate-dependent transferase [Kalaharituber pfeilii]|nr:pyridoxal phosphate-dependent transferase [Kalaharituber pfeilii]